MDLPRAATACALLLEGEGKRDAGDKEEEGEDGVVVGQAVPFHMIHLSGKHLCETTGKPGGKGCQESCSTHDEKHVEAPQGIERLQSFISFLFHDQ